MWAQLQRNYHFTERKKKRYCISAKQNLNKVTIKGFFFLSYPLQKYHTQRLKHVKEKQNTDVPTLNVKNKQKTHTFVHVCA